MFTSGTTTTRCVDERLPSPPRRWYGWLSVVVAGSLLQGCSGGLLDPAPYNPISSKSPIVAPAATDDAGFATIATQLVELSDGYSTNRDALMRQTAILDFGLIGLGAAAVANPVFDGAKAATIGLGLATGVGAATRSYLAPQTRIVIYNNAADALLCAASVSGEMSQLYSDDYATLKTLQDQLQANLSQARALFKDGKLSGDIATKLLDAQNAAPTALTQAQAALGDFDGGVSKLRTFALTTVSSANKGVVTGVQNLDAALKAVGSLAPSAGKSAPRAVGAGVGAATPTGEQQPTTTPAIDAETLADALNAEVSQAQPITSAVTAAWGRLSTCTPSS